MDAPQTLPITEPQPGQVITGFVVSHWQSPLGEYCLVVASAGVCHACRVDPAVRLQPADRVQLQAVALENSSTPAWEVHVRRLGTQYELLPGQHCQPRTRPAEEWLKEIQASILPELTAQHSRVRTERTAHETQRQRINPAGQPELLYPTAVALARREVLGPAYTQVCQAVQAAEQRSTEAALALHRHQKLAPHDPTARRRPWDWIRRWREGRSLRRQLQQARGAHQRLEAQRRQSERAANQPETIARVEQEARRLLETDRALARQCGTAALAERRASLRLAEAQKLIQYLERRLGSQATLHCTLVQGRAQMLPAIAGATVLPPGTPAQRIRPAPAVKTRGAQASAPPTPIQPPEKSVETPSVQPSQSAPRTAPAPAKSNGVRPRL